jgi:hypothetical protein
MAQDEDILYWALRQENEAFLWRQHWWWRHFLNGTLKSRQLVQRLAQEAEVLVARRIQTFGYQVYPTTHKAPFDLWVEDDVGRAVRVEVKISLYHLHRRGGRYQANVRHHRHAEILVFIARNGRDWPFVIPLPEIYPRTNVTIWAACPDDHHGRWAQYLDAWHYLHWAVEQAQPRARQLALFV